MQVKCISYYLSKITSLFSKTAIQLEGKFPIPRLKIPGIFFPKIFENLFPNSLLMYVLVIKCSSNKKKWNFVGAKRCEY